MSSRGWHTYNSVFTLQSTESVSYLPRLPETQEAFKFVQSYRQFHQYFILECFLGVTVLLSHLVFIEWLSLDPSHCSLHFPPRKAHLRDGEAESSFTVALVIS